MSLCSGHLLNEKALYFHLNYSAVLFIFYFFLRDGFSILIVQNDWGKIIMKYKRREEKCTFSKFLHCILQGVIYHPWQGWILYKNIKERNW